MNLTFSFLISLSLPSSISSTSARLRPTLHILIVQSWLPLTTKEHFSLCMCECQRERERERERDKSQKLILKEIIYSIALYIILVHACRYLDMVTAPTAWVWPIPTATNSNNLVLLSILHNRTVLSFELVTRTRPSEVELRLSTILECPLRSWQLPVSLSKIFTSSLLVATAKWLSPPPTKQTSSISSR